MAKTDTWCIACRYIMILSFGNKQSMGFQVEEIIILITDDCIIGAIWALRPCDPHSCTDTSSKVLLHGIALSISLTSKDNDLLKSFTLALYYTL